MRGRGKNRRPIISAPIGPVKSSRGADLIRSERLIIVDAIKNCETDSSSSTLESRSYLPAQSSSCISGGLASVGQLQSSPAVESFDVSAKPTIKVGSDPKSSKKLRRSLLSSNSSIPKPSFKVVSAAAPLSVPIVAQQDENIPPASDGFPRLDPPSRLVNNIPKSRTMSALLDLKTSISRPSLAVRSVNTSSFSGNSAKVSPSSTKPTATPPQLSKLSLMQPSSTISLAKSVQSCASESPSMRISGAQSSAYWSGRFMALHDRFSSENLAADARESRQSLAGPLSTQGKPPYSSLYQKTSHLPTSTTTSALRTLMTSSNTPSVTEDDVRCRRVFEHLDSLCTTIEARRSLHCWQQTYARRHCRPSLLPEGGSMEEKGFMAKIFGSSVSKKNERRSLTGLRHASYAHDNKSKSFLPGSISRASRGKRLTVL